MRDAAWTPIVDGVDDDVRDECDVRAHVKEGFGFLCRARGVAADEEGFDPVPRGNDGQGWRDGEGREQDSRAAVRRGRDRDSPRWGGDDGDGAQVSAGVRRRAHLSGALSVVHV